MLVRYTMRMLEKDAKNTVPTLRKRRRGGFVRRVFLTTGAFVLYIRDALIDDLRLVWREGRLFVGLFFVVVGIVSFASDKYCDGNTSSHYACTRPSTYYYYPWWAVTFVVVGSFFVCLWFLRRQEKR